MEFQLEKEYIELDKLLKILGLVESGGHAHQAVDEQLVTVNKEVELRRRRKLRKGDIVLFNGESIAIK